MHFPFRPYLLAQNEMILQFHEIDNTETFFDILYNERPYNCKNEQI